MRQVVDAIRAADPDYRPLSTSATGRAGGVGTRKVLSAGRIWTIVVAVVWSVLVVAAGGAAIATAMGLLRTVRRTTHASARLGTSHVATSDDIVTVEGNAYFPLSGVPEGVLQLSSTTSVCPWKGVASYYDVHVDGQVVPDGAFTYRHPSPLARRIKGRVAFWKGIEVDTTRPGTD